MGLSKNILIMDTPHTNQRCSTGFNMLQFFFSERKFDINKSYVSTRLLFLLSSAYLDKARMEFSEWCRAIQIPWQIY